MDATNEQNRLRIIDLYEHEDELAGVCFALSVPVRRKIIRLINRAPRGINEIAGKLKIPVSTASFHVKILVEAGLLRYGTDSRKRGNSKTVYLGNYLFTLSLGQNAHVYDNKVRQFEVPIGSYSDFAVEPTCGIYLRDGILLVSDTPAVFYSPERFRAGLIWLTHGHLTYTVPLTDFEGSRNKKLEIFDRRNISSICFRFEICSEAPNYDQCYKSDVTFTVNDKEACTFTLSGDFGEHRGALNPEWLPNSNTQYGLLTCVDVRYDGTYYNEKRISDLAIDDLELTKNDVLKFSIGVKKTAKHVGGFNLFGKCFGDYPQDITVSVTYLNRTLPGAEIVNH